MRTGLLTQNAKALAELDALGPFDKVKCSLELLEEVEAMEKALQSRFRQVMRNLRNNGVTFDEIADRAGIDAKELQKITARGSQVTDEASQGSSHSA